MEERLWAALAEAVDKRLGFQRQKDGTFVYEIYADYRDEMENETATEILQAQDPIPRVCIPKPASHY